MDGDHELRDRYMVCAQCGGDFVFTAREQLKYAQRDFDPPRRCPICRKNRTKLNGEEASHCGTRERRRRREDDDYWNY